MAGSYHIVIKKEYAAAVIKDLQLMDAVEIIADGDIDVLAWQVELGMAELQNIANGNTELIPWHEARKHLKL